MKHLIVAWLGLTLPALAEEQNETIVVTASRAPERAADAPAAVTVVSGAEIERAKSLDEAPRRDPSFAVCGRSSSLVADPSTQE